MSKFQLLSRDEYGQVSIIATSENVEDLIKQGKAAVTDINVNNALTTDDRERSWEAFLVLINTEDADAKYYYGGPIVGANKTIYKVAEKEVDTVALEDVPEHQVRFYLGNTSVKRNEEIAWFAKDIKKNEITKLNHQELQGKTMYYIKKV